MARLKILLADGHDIVRRGLRSLLTSHPGWTVCGDTRSGLDAIRLTAELKPDILILGLELADLNGIEVTRQVKRSHPATQVLIYTAHDEEYLIVAALKAGADGHVLKTDREDTLIEAVRSRPPGTSVLAAFREPVLDGLPRLGTDEAARLIVKSATLINASPSLQVRERELVARYTEILARLIAEESGAEADDVEATGVATALMGSQRALVAYVRARILAGERGPALVEQARSQATRVFVRLERGLADYTAGRG